MPPVKILAFSASLRPGSYNTRLATLAAKQIEAQGATVTLLDLSHYSLPIYDADIEAQGIPEAASRLHTQFCHHDGVFIASPEYNSFPPPLLLNALDWLSRVKKSDGGMIDAFERPVYALGSASPSPMAGYRGLTTLRQKLELGLGANVLPAMASISAAHEAFDADGNFANERNNEMLAKVMARLIKAAGRSPSIAN